MADLMIVDIDKLKVSAYNVVAKSLKDGLDDDIILTNFAEFNSFVELLEVCGCPLDPHRHKRKEHRKHGSS